MWAFGPEGVIQCCQRIILKRGDIKFVAGISSGLLTLVHQRTYSRVENKILKIPPPY
jgi:hypothetical protein